MRVTVTIDDDILALARTLARQNGVSLGRALSELARRGQCVAAAAAGSGGLPVFSVPRDAQAISSDDVYRALGK